MYYLVQVSSITLSLQMVICVWNSDWLLVTAPAALLNLPGQLTVASGTWEMIALSTSAPQHRGCLSSICLPPHPQALSLQGPVRLQQHQRQTMGRPHSPISTVGTPIWHRASCILSFGGWSVLQTQASFLSFTSLSWKPLWGRDEKYELKEVRSLTTSTSSSSLFLCCWW